MSDIASIKPQFKGDINDTGAVVHFYPKDDNDVLLAINYAKANKLRPAVNASGHMFAYHQEGDGVVIEMHKYFNNFTIDGTAKQATVGGGATWEGLVPETLKHVTKPGYGLAPIVGLFDHLGVGVLLGGGYGWNCGTKGLALDQLIEATVVTGSGKILVVNASENSDLYWGIRGGGSNFGVVTKLRIQLYEVPLQVYAGTYYFDSSKEFLEKLAPVTKQIYEVDAVAEPRIGMSQMFNAEFTIPGGTSKDYTEVVVYWPGTKAEGEAKFKALLDLKPAYSDADYISYLKAGQLMNSAASRRGVVYMEGAKQLSPNLATMQALHYYTYEVAKANPDYENILFFDYVDLGKVNEGSPNKTAFRRSKATNLLLIIFTRDNITPSKPFAVPAKDSQGRPIPKLTDLVAAYQQNLVPADKVGFYANYSTDTSEAYTKKVFGDNYPKLQQVKKEYDPDVVFSKWYKIIPA